MESNQMHYIFTPESLSNILNGQFGPPRSSTVTIDDKLWIETVDLSSFPTKPDDLHIQLDSELRIMTVSGKAEVNPERKKGFIIFSTIKWMRDITIPETVDFGSLNAKLKIDVLTVSGRFTEQARDSVKIPINRVTHIV